jgi:hypothetical protein
MSNMNSRERNFVYPLIAQRDGEVCRCCGKLASETKEQFLLIDHKDNNNSNNHIDNLQLLCRSCNYLKNPRRDPSEERPQTPEMKKGERMERYFRNWLFGLITENHKWLLEDIIDAGAEKTGGSTETIKRYVRKCISSEGMYEVVEGQLGREFMQFKAEHR